VTAYPGAGVPLLGVGLCILEADPLVDLRVLQVADLRDIQVVVLRVLQVEDLRDIRVVDLRVLQVVGLRDIQVVALRVLQVVGLRDIRVVVLRDRQGDRQAHQEAFRVPYRVVAL